MLAFKVAMCPLPNNLLNKGSTWETRGGGGDSGFPVTGMVEGFFLNLTISIPGFFWVGKLGKYFFGWLDLSREFLGIPDLCCLVLRIKHIKGSVLGCL